MGSVSCDMVISEDGSCSLGLPIFWWPVLRHAIVGRNVESRTIMGNLLSEFISWVGRAGFPVNTGYAADLFYKVLCPVD
jgi:hypothetical protein